MTDKTAVLAVDVQGDFTQLKQGALAVEGTGKAYLDEVVACVEKFKKAGYPVIATQDWHPGDHISFYTNTPGAAVLDVLDIDGRSQVLWPPHCIQESENAGILMDGALVDQVIQKGTHPKYDSYSGFFDDGGEPTGLEAALKERGIETIVVFGLATDYCVKATAMDGLGLGFKVVLVSDLCRAVSEDTGKAALEQMAKAGVRILPRLPENLSQI